MNTYIVNLIKIASSEDETKFKCEKLQQGAYFFNLSDAVYFIQNNMNSDSIKKEYNYITVIGVPVGVINANPTELYVFEYSANANTYNEVSKEADVYKFLITVHHVEIVNEKPVIKLDLSKEEMLPTKEFVSTLKENIENKDYGKVKEMIEQKEAYVSNQINDFLNNVSDSLNAVDSTVNKLFDILNGNFN